MKKLQVLCIALSVVLACIFGTDQYVKSVLDKNAEKAVYDNNIYTRNRCDYVLDQVIDENSIVVLGSSELFSDDTVAYPQSLFNNGYSNFNMVLIGGGYYQSLIQTIALGAFQNNMKNNKVVLIVSPQWFSGEGISADIFSSRFVESNYVEFIRNPHISDKSKTAVSMRVNSLLSSDTTTLERIKKDQDIYLYHKKNPFTYLEMSSYNAFRNAKTRFEIVKELKSLVPLDKKTMFR